MKLNTLLTKGGARLNILEFDICCLKTRLMIKTETTTANGHKLIDKSIGKPKIEDNFSEVILTTLVSKGFFEIMHPLASDKAALRENLKEKLKEALILNTRNAPLLEDAR